MHPMEEGPATSPASTLLAAVDLGSNSFHMVVAEEVGTEIRLLDRLREGVRLAAGLRKNGTLDPVAEYRALECLARFGQRLRGIPKDRIRVVGTNTLRQIRSADSFLQGIETALGVPAEIVAGREEARLIYLGVAHALAVDPGERRLVVDIGGGSTEIVAGRGFTPEVMESLHFGCVGSTIAHFPSGRITRGSFEALYRQVRLAMEASLAAYLRFGWDQAIGSSGTVKAILRILQENGRGPRITHTGLVWLRGEILRLGDVQALGQIRGLKADRGAVFPGGLAILCALFDALQIGEMRFSEGALREGVIYDLLGRIHHEDTRELGILNLQERFHSQRERNAEAGRWAQRFFRIAGPVWNLQEYHWRWLSWAAATHDIGLDIAHSGFHRHGEYIWRNADIAGFSRREQQIMAALVRLQRKKLPSEVQVGAMGIQEEDIGPVRHLAILLRLGILFQRGADGLGEEPGMMVLGRTLHFRFAPGWMRRVPLLAAELENEQGLVSPDFQILC